MRTLDEISEVLDGVGNNLDAHALLAIGEETLENWILARNDIPTDKKKEGFRLLALHRQGAKGAPSFNACRETCRELVYHFNLITLDPDNIQFEKKIEMMHLVTRHLYYFVSGKLEQDGLGEFCCSSRPLRANIGA